ncbi:PQQ-dependent sugar dehydrogenase [Fertoebacter nigrum]|uniref:PQQ-dependent sugar dehydrogenase n=2 Tax=Fertoeibacter niger TaxID=2656921 RepID=A0A8X8KJK6_9RHOB|nr:PQQ-dependent sugar dehydrogenase [Fertoeibacter niger]
MTTLSLSALIAGIAALPLAAAAAETSAGPVSITAMADGLDEPWGLAFLPDGRFLVTERGGRLTLHAADGAGEPAAVAGLPQVVVGGQGGLLDVMIPADFATTREVWLSFSAADGAGAGTAVGRGILSEDGARLDDFTTFHTVAGQPGGRHFGARLVEGPEGQVFLTTGDRGQAMLSQDPARGEGKVLLLGDSGAEVYSLGHRNPQGAALDAAGRLWVVEHGAKGGDELNLVEPGRNYGWPVISYGVDYDGSQIGEGQAKGGMQQPVHYWDPSIAPSGLMIHSGTLFDAWAGDVFTGSLKFDHISRLDPDNGYAEERIETPETARVRDVREGPDGAIWFLSVGNGAVYRMAPDT